MTRHPYIARHDGWIAGQRVAAGEKIHLSEAEARFEPVDPVPEPEPPKAPASRRRRAKP